MLVLGLLLGLQPVSTDLVLPALPALATELGSGMPRAQLTLAAMMLAFGASQLWIGPLADRMGRRPVLLGGLALYVLAALGGAWAAGVDALIGWRALQGVGLACSVVCGRAMVRDLFAPEQGARVMTWGMTGLGLCALASPVAGGLLAHAQGWRSAWLAMAVFAAAALALVAWRLPETALRRDLAATGWTAVSRGYAAIAAHKEFQTWALLVGLTYGSLYTFLAASSFVFIDLLGLTRPVYGLVLAASSLAYLTGTLLCQRWLRRVGMHAAVQRGGVFMLAGALGFSALALTGWHPAWAIATVQAVFMLGHGIHQPCAQAGVVAPFARAAGAASALAGFALSLVAFGLGLWLGWTLRGSAWPMLMTQATLCAGAALLAWTAVPRLALTR